MLDLIAQVAPGRKAQVLCIGAHCDDIEIGCGGALQVLQARRSKLSINWVVLSGTPQRRMETQRAMALLVKPKQRGQLSFGDFADGMFPAQYGAVKQFFESLKRLPRPDLIFCHERADLHQDHRSVNEMVWNTFRDHLVLEYEIPKWDGGLGRPAVYIPLSATQLKAKVAALMQAYRSQRTRDWFSPETFTAIARLRGIECRSPSGYAEAFHAPKLRFAGL
jgi:LmbE family N-acetylglucosaminyl deacetylase